MRTEDGRVIHGVAKETEAARREHRQAIREGKMTGLVEHVSDDSTSSKPVLSSGGLTLKPYITSLHRIPRMLTTVTDDHNETYRKRLAPASRIPSNGLGSMLST